MKKVEVVLYASLQKYQPRVRGGYTLEDRKPVSEILDEIGIPEDYVMLIMINDKRSRLDSMVEGGDRLCLFPPIGGG